MKIKFWITILVLLIGSQFYLLVNSVQAYENEAYHNIKWCAMQHEITQIDLVKGQDFEVRTPWGGWVDCLLPGMAIEADWDYKYRQGFIQAMEYGFLMNRRAGLLLIRRDGSDIYIERARILKSIFNYPVDIFVMDRE